MRWALILGHPGHELRVLGWIRRARPVVSILTTGSADPSLRLTPTRTLLRDAGARTGPVFGAVSDREMYARMMARDVTFFRDLARRLADWLEGEAIDQVAGDALEGYNPTHDVCRLLIDSAVRECRRRGSWVIGNFAIPLVGGAMPDPMPAGAIRVTLDPESLAAKLALARGYAATAGGTLLQEIDDLLARHGGDAFREEVLYPQDTSALLVGQRLAPPHYEQVGEARVSRGRYASVLRFAEHVEPIAVALQQPLTVPCVS